MKSSIFCSSGNGWTTRTLALFGVSLTLSSASVVFCGSMALSSEWTPDIDYAKIEAEVRGASPSIGFVPENWKKQLVGKQLDEKARALFEKGEYAEALKYYRYILKISESASAGIGEGKCLEKLGDTQKALDIYRADVVAVNSDAGYECLIDLLTKENRYEEALKYCEKFSAHSPSLSGLLMQSQVLEQSGDHSGAVDAAQRAYLHCWHTGEDAQKLKAVEAQLQSLHAEPEQHPTPVTSGNQFILQTLHKFAAQANPPTLAEVEKTFALDMQVIPRKWTPDSPFKDYVSNKVFSQPLVEVRFGNETLEKRGCMLSVWINTDFASITPAMLQREFGKTKFSPYQQLNRCCFSTAMMTYEKRRPRLQFEFASGGLNPLRQVEIDWFVKEDPSKSAQDRTEPEPGKIADSAGDVDELGPKVQALVEQSKWQDAAKLLQAGWNEFPASYKVQKRLDLARERRKLLTAAYRGMKRDDIADFVQQAPLSIIHRTIMANSMQPVPNLLTIEQYKLIPWAVDGWTNCSTDGTVDFRWHGYEICTVSSTSPRWAEYYKIFGPRPLSPPTPIPLPSGHLVDLIDADEFRAGL